MRGLMGRSLGREICEELEIKIDETYLVVNCCCPLYVLKVSEKMVSFIFPT